VRRVAVRQQEMHGGCPRPSWGAVDFSDHPVPDHGVDYFGYGDAEPDPGDHDADDSGDSGRDWD
jgi:hypothetical protein